MLLKSGRAWMMGCLLAAVLCASAHGEPMAPSGSIYEDALWRGQITISSDVSIVGATVRVEAGSVIRFLGADSAVRMPVIALKGTSLQSGLPRRESRLILQGTADDPVVVETPESDATAGQPRGAIIADPMSACSLVAQHAIFRRLGAPVSPTRCEPAVSVSLISEQNDLWLRNCHFEQCGPVYAEFMGSGATAEIAGCTFAHTTGETALEMLGTGDGIRAVTDNVTDGTFRIDCPQVLMRGNVLVGESASIAVYSTTATGIAIVDNYVHRTTRSDDGRYALRCDAPDAIVSGNVLRGGTYVAQSGPRTVTGNVFVGADGLEPKLDLPGLDVKRLKTTTSTHCLLRDVPPGAVVTDNLFLGPAYAALAIGRGSPGVRVEHNLFDGWGAAGRAIDLNPLTGRRGEGPLGATLTRNVITRYRSAPVLDGSGRKGTLAEVGGNLFAEVPEPPYEKALDVPGMAPGDRRLETFGQLRLMAAATTQSAAQRDDQLVARQIGVAEVRAMWESAYRPRPDSPMAAPSPVGPRSDIPRP